MVPIAASHERNALRISWYRQAILANLSGGTVKMEQEDRDHSIWDEGDET